MEPNAILFSLFTFFLGALIGNRLALGRDKRKERNDAAQEVRSVLLKYDGVSPLNPYPSAVDLDALEQRLRWWERRGFRKAIARYKESRKHYKQDSIGGVFYDAETSAVVRTNLDALLRYTRWH